MVFSEISQNSDYGAADTEQIISLLKIKKVMTLLQSISKKPYAACERR